MIDLRFTKEKNSQNVKILFARARWGYRNNASKSEVRK